MYLGIASVGGSRLIHFHHGVVWYWWALWSVYLSCILLAYKALEGLDICPFKNEGQHQVVLIKFCGVGMDNEILCSLTVFGVFMMNDAMDGV